MPKGFLTASLLGLVILALMFTAAVHTSFATSATYLPAIPAGKGAEYKELYFSCQPEIRFACSVYGDPFAGLDFALLHVVSVSETNVTLSLISVYKNGTASSQGALDDVDSGASNVTLGGVIPGSELVLAGGLQAPNPIWHKAGAPTINQTTSRNLLGTPRTVNFLNTTSLRSAFGEKVHISAGLAFDQQYGILVGATIHATGTGVFGDFTVDALLGMMDNDLWLSSSVLNFALMAKPTSISTIPGSTTTSTIRLIRTSGFTGAVNLSLHLSSAFSCSLASSMLVPGADGTTLSCSGPLGTYPVTVTGDSGYSVNSVIVTLTVGDFSIASDTLFSFESGSPGSTRVTLSGFSGFTSAINITLTSSPSGLACNVDLLSVMGGGSVVVRCDGQPGSYLLKVTGTSGTDSHSTQIRVEVSAPPVTLSEILGAEPVILSLSVAVVVVVGVFSLYLRRKYGKHGLTPAVGST